MNCLFSIVLETQLYNQRHSLDLEIDSFFLICGASFPVVQLVLCYRQLHAHKNDVLEANGTSMSLISGHIRGINIYVSFADEDEALWQELEKHLTPLKQLGYISQLQHHSLSLAGVEWLKEA